MTKTVLLDCARYLREDNVTNQAWWQVFIVLLTVFLTSFLTHYFTNRNQRSSQLTYAKANLSKYAYQLDQVTTSYLESLLNSYYYMVAVRNTEPDSRNMHFEMMKAEGARSADLALEISKTKSTMIGELSIIRRIAGYKTTAKLEQLFNAVVYFEGYNVLRPSYVATEVEADEYAKANIKSIVENSEQLKKKIAKLTVGLDNINVANTPLGWRREK